LERYADAEKDFTKEIEADPRDPTIYCSRAQSRRKLGKYDDALKDILAARQRVFGLDIQIAHTVVLCEGLHFTQALQIADKMIELYPNSATARMVRASVLVALDREKDADKEFAKAVELNPTFKDQVDPSRIEAREYRAKAELQKQAPAPRPKQ